MVSERKRAANRANAQKPRSKWAGTPERAALDEAKRTLREALPGAAVRLRKIIDDPATPPELFLQAMKLAADRAGLPVQTQHDVKQDTPYTQLFFVARDFEHAETTPDADRMDAGHDGASATVGH